MSRKTTMDQDVKSIEWLNKHEKVLRRYYGKWIAFTLEKGILGVGESMGEAEAKARAAYPRGPLDFYHVPRKDEGNYILCK